MFMNRIKNISKNILLNQRRFLKIDPMNNFKNNSTCNLVTKIGISFFSHPILIKSLNISNYDKFSNSNKFINFIKNNPVLEKGLKETIFKNFCGGENIEEVKETAKRIESKNTGVLFDCALTESNNENIEMVKINEEVLSNMKSVSEKFSYLSMNKYFVAPNFDDDVNLKKIKESIDIAAACDLEKMVAVKLSSLCNYDTMVETSKYLVKLKQIFENVSESNLKFDKPKFKLFLKSLGVEIPSDEIEKIMKTLPENITYRTIEYLFYPSLPLLQIWTPNGNDLEFPTEIQSFYNFISQQKILYLLEYAKDKNVTLLIDAEQSWTQPFIDCHSLQAMRKFNTDHPLILNSYQCYLKGSYKKIISDLEFSKFNNFILGVKLVRGAYLVQESKMSDVSPILESYDLVSENYNALLGVLIEYISENNLKLVVATHNEHSVEHAANLMEKYNINLDCGKICFAQLYGMADHITNQLSNTGYRTVKYLPYGSVEDVLPYLIRRIEENGDLVERNRQLIMVMLSELLQRFKRERK